MAHLYPEYLPDSVASDAERKLYKAFEERLDDRFTVYAGVKWMRVNQRGQARPAEADFVVVHPERGMLLIEVKGGGIRYDGTSGNWFSRDRHGSFHEIKDPAAQAQQNYFSLRDKLAETVETGGRYYPGGHGVAFPDVSLSGISLPLDLPREIVIDADDLISLRRAIMTMFRYWYGDRRAGIGADGVSAITGILRRSWQVEAPLANAIRDEERTFNTLTEEQFRMLDFLGNQPRALVSGCAGSGKTFLAIEKARRLAAEGFDTLLTCFNKGLAVWIRESLSPLLPTLRVQHFHELAYELVGQAGLPNELPDNGDLSEFFDVILPERLLEASDIIGPLFDAMVVDEGQDFKEEWWIPLQSLLRSPDKGILYVFYDDRQCIYTDDVSPPFDAHPYLLTENLRNTRSIHQYIAHHYPAAITCRGPQGRSPSVIAATDQPTALQRQLERLIDREAIPPTDVVILTPASESRSHWKNGQKIGRFTLSWSQNLARNEILVSTIHSFKGLESPVVILTEMGETVDEELELVAHSRARNELVIIQEAGS